MPDNSQTNFHKLRHKLETHHKKVVEEFHRKHHTTIKKAKKHGLALASTAILASSILTATPPDLHSQKFSSAKSQEMARLNEFMLQLGKILNQKDKLNPAEEQVVAEALSKKFDMNLKISIAGNRLNDVFGYIGAEQHLKRWNGDTLTNHDIQKAGMAPLQGSFKDFDNAEQEKYYVAVQLHELPEWNEKWAELKPWYRYRKVFIYNPDNQKGIVAVIGDSGPAMWTGKIFGGSPEVMDYLDRVDGAQKGKVVILLIDDPENKIALGPANAIDTNLALKN